MEQKLYTWDEIYERAIGCAYLSPELVAKDMAREHLGDLILRECGYDIEECECPEDEIDLFLWARNNPVLFDEQGRIVEEDNYEQRTEKRY